MRTFTILLLLIPFTYLSANDQIIQKKLPGEPLSDERMRETSLPILPNWLTHSETLMARVSSTESLLSLVDFVHTLRNTAASGVPEELSYVLNLQNFLDNLTDPTQDLDYISLLLKEVFKSAGINFDLDFENVQTRGHNKMIFLDNDGNELFTHDGVDFIGRISITNIRFGNSPISIGNIYISNLDWAPGNVMRIRVRD